MHVVVFFIFLVANIGGGLTPLGDPPLFLGFLKGVSFGWTVQHMVLPVLVLSLALLAIFYALDSYFFKKEAQTGTLPEIDRSKDKPIKLHGKRNLFLLAGIIAAVLMSGIWKPGVVFDIMGTHVGCRISCATWRCWPWPSPRCGSPQAGARWQ